jgi:hypothetical protein
VWKDGRVQTPGANRWKRGGWRGVPACCMRQLPHTCVHVVLVQSDSVGRSAQHGAQPPPWLVSADAGDGRVRWAQDQEECGDQGQGPLSRGQGQGAVRRTPRPRGPARLQRAGCLRPPRPRQPQRARERVCGACTCVTALGRTPWVHDGAARGVSASTVSPVSVLRSSIACPSPTALLPTCMHERSPVLCEEGTAGGGGGGGGMAVPPGSGAGPSTALCAAAPSAMAAAQELDDCAVFPFPSLCLCLPGLGQQACTCRPWRTPHTRGRWALVAVCLCAGLLFCSPAFGQCCSPRLPLVACTRSLMHSMRHASCLFNAQPALYQLELLAADPSCCRTVPERTSVLLLLLGG